MIGDFFTTTFQTKRAVWLEDESGNSYSNDAVIGSFLGHIQQLDAELAQYYGLSLTKTFSIWCSVNTNVLEGDIVNDALTSYSVRAKQLFNEGNNKHIQLIVEQDDIAVIGS